MLRYATSQTVTDASSDAKLATETYNYYLRNSFIYFGISSGLIDSQCVPLSAFPFDRQDVSRQSSKRLTGRKTVRQFLQ